MIINTESHDNWATPKEFYMQLDCEFMFDFDPCPLNSVFDGLAPSTKWGKCNFINPPYSLDLKNKFVKRAFYEWSQNDNTCVLLLPVSTSTKLFHEYILPHAEIRFVKGRLKFVENGKEVKQTGTRDSMIVIFRGKASLNVDYEKN
jgi:site-specific DNA-methyltransferase (adenine-specific)